MSNLTSINDQFRLLCSTKALLELDPAQDPNCDVILTKKAFEALSVKSWVLTLLRMIKIPAKKRAVKNLISVVRLGKMSDIQLAELREFCRKVELIEDLDTPESKKKRKEEIQKFSPPAGLSLSSALNFVGYLDTDRLGANLLAIQSFLLKCMGSASGPTSERVRVEEEKVILELMDEEHEEGEEELPDQGDEDEDE